MTINPDFNPGEITNDPIVNKVVDIVMKRHMQGMEKFGKTMDSNERPLDQWIDETIEELLDAVHYLVKAKSITDRTFRRETHPIIIVRWFAATFWVFGRCQCFAAHTGLDGSRFRL